MQVACLTQLQPLCSQRIVSLPPRCSHPGGSLVDCPASWKADFHVGGMIPCRVLEVS